MCLRFGPLIPGARQRGAQPRDDVTSRAATPALSQPDEFVYADLELHKGALNFKPNLKGAAGSYRNFRCTSTPKYKPHW